MNSAISCGVSAHPPLVWLVPQFWQKTHFRLHPPKKIVPLPNVP